jgi:AcrR family transcriptional regulator
VKEGRRVPPSPTATEIDAATGQMRRRADARRNNDALIEAATRAFAGNVDVPLEEIARRAGLGIGTLYRHFPNRDALVLAVYRRDVAQLIDGAAELTRTLPAYDALAAWMRRFVIHAATKRGMRGALKAMSESNPHLFADVRNQLLETIGQLSGAAADEGAIRADVEVEDILRALGGICMVSEGDDWQDRSARLLRLLLDGLRFGAPAPV